MDLFETKKIKELEEKVNKMLFWRALKDSRLYEAEEELKQLRKLNKKDFVIEDIVDGLKVISCDRAVCVLKEISPKVFTLTEIHKPFSRSKYLNFYFGKKGKKTPDCFTAEFLVDFLNEELFIKE